MKVFIKNNKGITLITLVITIVILLIISGISIGWLAGNGLFKKAELAKENYENSHQLENNTLAHYEDEIEKYVDGTREEKDESKIQKTVLFYGTATSTNVEYELTDSVKNYSFLLVSTGNVKNITTEGIKHTSTLLIDTIDIDYETNMNNKQRFIISPYLGSGYYGIRFGFVSDKKFVIDQISLGSSWSSEVEGIYKIIGIK